MNTQPSNRKFLNLLASLNKKEVENFRHYLQNPQTVINNKKSSINVLNYFIENAHKSKNDSGEVTLSFPDDLTAYLKQNRTVVSNLTKALEFYLGTIYQVKQSVSRNKYQNKLNYLEFLLEKKLFNLFQNQYKETSKKLKEEKLSEQVYYNLMQLEQIGINKLVLTEKKEKEINFQDFILLTNRYNFLSTLKKYCSSENSILVRGIKAAQNNDIQPIDSFLKVDSQFIEDGLIVLFYQILNAIKNLDTPIEYLKSLLDQIKNYENQIAKEEINILLSYLANICLEKTRIDEDPQYRLLLVDIYQYLDKIDLLITGNKVNIRRLLSFINEAAKAKNFEWGELLISKHMNRLQKKNHIYSLQYYSF